MNGPTEPRPTAADSHGDAAEAGERQRNGISGVSAADLRTVAKGTIIQFLGTATNRASGVFFVAIAIRLLGAVGFGVYRQVAQVLMTMCTVASLGFDVALLRSVAQARAKGDSNSIRRATRTAVSVVTAVSLALFLILFIAADSVAGVFADQPARQDEMRFLIRLGAAYVPLMALAQLLSAGTTGYKTVVPSVLIGNILQPVSLLVLSILAILAGYGVGGAIGGLVASGLVALLAAIWFYRRLLPPDGGLTSDASWSLRSMAAFALPRAGANALRLGTAGVLLMGWLGSDREVALLTVALSLQSVALIFPQASLSIWKPMVVDLVEREETERMRSLYQTVTRWVASGSFGFILALVVLPEPFVELLGGRGIQDAALLTSIVAVGTLFQVASGPCGMLITMAGFPIINLLNSVVVTALYIVAAWIFVPTHGVIGMAVIHGAATAASNLVLVVAAKRLTGLQPFGWSFLKPVLATGLAAVLLLAWRIVFERGVLLDLTGLVVASALYGLTLWLAGFDREDRIVYERIVVRLREFRFGKRGSASL